MIRSDKYTGTAMALHWAIAVLIIGNVALSFLADSFPESWVRTIVDTHKSVGITVLGLAILRLLWRVAHRPPPLPSTYPAWEKTSAHAAHVALYVVIFGLPLSGWLHDSAWTGAATHPMFLFGLVPWPRLWFFQGLDDSAKDHWHAVLFTVHKAFGYALYGLLALHVLGALKHQFIDKEPELQRMLP